MCYYLEGWLLIKLSRRVRTSADGSEKQSKCTEHGRPQFGMMQTELRDTS